MTDDARDGVLAALQAWDDAVLGKDLNALERCYDPEVTVFDLCMQFVGWPTLRAQWEQAFPYYPDPIVATRKELRIEASGGLAVTHAYLRLAGMTMDHPSAKSWYRNTMCFRKTGGARTIYHDHYSLPMDGEAEKVQWLLDD